MVWYFYKSEDESNFRKTSTVLPTAKRYVWVPGYRRQNFNEIYWKILNKNGAYLYTNYNT